MCRSFNFNFFIIHGDYMEWWMFINSNTTIRPILHGTNYLDSSFHYGMKILGEDDYHGDTINQEWEKKIDKKWKIIRRKRDYLENHGKCFIGMNVMTDQTRPEKVERFNRLRPKLLSSNLDSKPHTKMNIEIKLWSQSHFQGINRSVSTQRMHALIS